MFDFIKGKISSTGDNYAVIENNGIGFKIITTRSSLENIGKENAVFYTYLYVREDVLDLYGFATQEERSAFLLLITVNGVGPKAALAILSCVTASDLALAVVTNQPKVLTAAPGVGNKMAQKIILELKDKIKNKDLAPSSYTAGTPSVDDDSLNALMALGYGQSEAVEALKGMSSDMSVEDKIKEALKKFAMK